MPPLAPDGSADAAIPSASVTARAIRFCKSCGVPWDPAWLACPHCDARRQGQLQLHEAEAGFRSDVRRVKIAVALYFALLAVSALTMIAMIASESEELPVLGDIAASAAMALITIGWCLGTWRDLIPLLRRTGPAWTYPLAALTAVGTVIIAAVAVGALERLVNMPTIEYLEGYTNEGYGLQWAVLMVCVMPAVFEELGFRGVILSALEHVLGGRQALLVSAMMFAILHLSIPGIPHLFVLGVVLGWMRQRTGSIYPSIVTHFTHNFIVLILEYNEGLLPW